MDTFFRCHIFVVRRTSMKQAAFTDREITAITRLSSRGQSTREIASLFNVSSACISYWLRTSAACRSRITPRSVIPRKRRKLVAAIARGVCVVKDTSGAVTRRVPTHGSASSIVKTLVRGHGIVVTKQTVLRDLRFCGFSSRVRPKTPTTAAGDTAARCAFAKNMVFYPETFFARLVFSDEKVFTSNDATWRRMWVRAAEDVLPRESLGLYRSGIQALGCFSRSSARRRRRRRRR